MNHENCTTKAPRRTIFEKLSGITKVHEVPPDLVNSAQLKPVEVVPDHILHKLAAGDAARQRGEISEEDTAILTMVLPDICGELLAYRLAARRGV